MKQLELFVEPGTESERLWEEIAISNQKISNICRSLHGKIDLLKEQIHELRAENANIKKELGIKECILTLIEYDKAS